jgi:hypothetical protein
MKNEPSNRCKYGKLRFNTLLSYLAFAFRDDAFIEVNSPADLGDFCMPEMSYFPSSRRNLQSQIYPPDKRYEGMMLTKTSADKARSPFGQAVSPTATKSSPYSTQETLHK